jgi:hypothetical protein
MRFGAAFPDTGHEVAERLMSVVEQPLGGVLEQAFLWVSRGRSCNTGSLINHPTAPDVRTTIAPNEK